jgi:ArsR family transcriptional regulator
MKHFTDVCAAVANPLRLRVVNMLARRPLCVCQMASALGVSYSKLSNHLAILKKAGLTRERRDGLWVEHSLIHATEGSPVSLVIESVRVFARRDPACRADVAKLKGALGTTPLDEICRKLRRRNGGKA